MRYEFKVTQEIIWAFSVGAGTAILEILIKFDPSIITDWSTWAIAAGAAVLRAGAAAALPVLLKLGKQILTRE